MALGLVHVRGKLCKYQAGKKRGKFVRCVKAGKQGYRATKPLKSGSKKRGSKPRTTPASGNAHCKTIKVKMFGQGAKKQCRKVCWGTNGKIKSNKPSKGCR